MSLLDVRDLRLIYPNGHEALKRVSFSAQAGEIVCIIGRSGAGKSTLLRCVNGLEKATADSIVLDDEDITKMSQEQLTRLRRHIGFVWQEFNLCWPIA